MALEIKAKLEEFPEASFDVNYLDKESPLKLNKKGTRSASAQNRSSYEGFEKRQFRERAMEKYPQLQKIYDPEKEGFYPREVVKKQRLEKELWARNYPKEGLPTNTSPTQLFITTNEIENLSGSSQSTKRSELQIMNVSVPSPNKKSKTKAEVIFSDMDTISSEYYRLRNILPGKVAEIKVDFILNQCIIFKRPELTWIGKGIPLRS